MEDKLLPCPFCGGEASIYHGDSTDGYIKGTSYVLAFCGLCGASIREKKEDEVIKKWNNRPSAWHTGTPTEEGDYYIAFRHLIHEDVEYGWASWDGKGWDINFLGWHLSNEILAWQKIEPYKEMDILIKGMELPKTENDNFMVIVTPTGVIDVVENGNGFMMQKKYKAIELPPHGRLIDATELEASDAILVGEEAWNMIHNAPTVLEANNVADN